MSARVVAAGALALALGCGSDTLDPIVIDVSNNCAAVDVEVALSRTESATLRVLQAAADGPKATTAWLLVERAAPGGGTELALEHHGETRDAEVWIHLMPTQADQLSLRPGPIAGEAWLLERAPGHLQVTHVDATAVPPLVARSFELGSFPQDATCDEDDDGIPELCDTTDWPRELIFMKQVPHLASVPPDSVDLSLHVDLARLQDDLTPIPMPSVGLAITCDQTLLPMQLQACQEALARRRWSALELLGVQSDPRPATASLLLRREEEDDAFEFVGTDVLHLELGLDSNGVLAALHNRCIGATQSAPCEVVPSALPDGGPPSGIAVDGYDAYALFATMTGAASLWHMPDTGELVELMPLSTDVELLQLDRDLAIGRLVDGSWEITKVFPDAPDQSEVTTWGTAVTAVGAAGPGSFLVHDKGEAHVVHLACRE